MLSTRANAMRDDSVYDSSYAAKSDANEKKRYCGLASSLRRTLFIFYLKEFILSFTKQNYADALVLVLLFIYF
tara:strand:- start:976 stop:1194 length:219 start_codon:yes stop_codon:yes gene_type:complete